LLVRPQSQSCEQEESEFLLFSENLEISANFFIGYFQRTAKQFNAAETLIFLQEIPNGVKLLFCGIGRQISDDKLLFCFFSVVSDGTNS